MTKIITQSIPKRSFLQLSVLSALLLSNYALANDVEVFTINGSHIPQDALTGTVPSISLSSEQIAALAANSFADVLKGLPGVDISQQGGISGLTYLSIRGGDPNFVVVLIDGVKVNDPTNSRGGAFDLGSIDPDMVEKVEIFFGSFSSVYGSDGLSGVLSIQTKKATEEVTASAKVKVGSNMKGASVRVSSPVKDAASFNLLASIQEGDNSTFSDAFRRKELIGSLSSTLSTDTKWALSGLYVQGEGQYFPEDSGGDRLAVIRTPETRDYNQTNVGAKIQHAFNGSLGLTFNAANTERKEQLASPGIAQGVLDAVPAIDSDTEYQRTDLDLTANYQLSDYLSAALGVAHSDEDGGMQSIIDFGFPVEANYSLRRKTQSAFTEIAVKPTEALNIMAGVRRDKTELLSVSSQRVLANFSVDDRTELSAQYSQGFKLPSFFALAHPLVGNPELQPERSENMEISLDKKLLQNSLSTSISLYQNTYKDLVDFDPELFTNVNRSKVRVRGAELSGNFQASDDLNLSAQITYTDLNTYDPEVVLRRRPKFKGSMNLSYQATPSVKVVSRYTVNGKYFDSSIPTGSLELDGYNQLDLSAHWQMYDNIDWRLHINNLLDEDQEQSIGFDNTGISFASSISVQF